MEATLLAVRSRLFVGVAITGFAFIAAMGLLGSSPAESSATVSSVAPAATASAGPLAAVPAQDAAGTQDLADLNPSVVRPAASQALSLDQTRVKVAETEAALQVVVLQKRSDDLRMSRAAAGVAELEDEAREVAESTVASAVKAFQRGPSDVSILDVQDLNAGFRASTLNEAALLANTEIFNQFYAKQQDADIAAAELEVFALRNNQLSDRVAVLEEELQADQAWLAQLEERNLQQRARSVTAQASTWTQNRGRKQGFYLLTCPVNGPHSFIDSWGFPRSGGRRHKGVDILANIGVEIVAPVNGRVEHFSNRVGGRSFRMWDDNGNYFYGTHLSGFGVEGEVSAGEVIGYVGDDGNAAGIPHLHFEIHAGGRGNQINPFIDSAAVCSGAG